MPYQAILFDLDGTLVHTTPEYRYQVLTEITKTAGVRPSRRAMDRFWFECQRDDIITKDFQMNPEIFWSLFRASEQIELRKQHIRAYDDVSYIQELRQQGYKTGIVTGASEQIVEIELELIGPQHFDTIILAQEEHGIRYKPDPHGLYEAMKNLIASPRQTLYIGNADEDIWAAQKAGVKDVLLKRGEHEFPHIKPSYTIDSLQQLERIIEK